MVSHTIIQCKYRVLTINIYVYEHFYYKYKVVNYDQHHIAIAIRYIMLRVSDAIYNLYLQFKTKRNEGLEKHQIQSGNGRIIIF